MVTLFLKKFYFFGKLFSDDSIACFGKKEKGKYEKPIRKLQLADGWGVMRQRKVWGILRLGRG